MVKFAPAAAPAGGGQTMVKQWSYLAPGQKEWSNRPVRVCRRAGLADRAERGPWPAESFAFGPAVV